MNRITYVDATIGNDEYDGSSLTYQGGKVGPTKTIKKGLAVTLEGGTCFVAPGMYHCEEPMITVRKRSLIGAGPNRTLLRHVGGYSNLGIKQPLIDIRGPECIPSKVTVSNLTIIGGFIRVGQNCSPYICNNIFTQSYFQRIR